jgi:hypothetical protein
LDEHGFEPRTQHLRGGEEFRHRLGAANEPTLVRDLTRELEGESEIARDRQRPTFEPLRRRRPVEGRIDLDAAELTRVRLQIALGLRTAVVDAADPIAVRPALSPQRQRRQGGD